jgi:hypothetical protein
MTVTEQIKAILKDPPDTPPPYCIVHKGYRFTITPVPDARVAMVRMDPDPRTFAPGQH